MTSENPHNTISRIDLSLVGNVDMIGRIIAGRWQIVCLLGQGRMSTVYKAEEEHSRKPVVLKLLHRQLLEGNDLKDLEERARNLITLNHDNISNFHDIYLSSANEFFLCCDYFQADSLQSILSTEGHISIERATKIFIEVTEGLGYAHKQNILHKDIGPSNISLINDSVRTDCVKIVDFGIKNLVLAKVPELESSTTPVAKHWDATYMSPEQCLNKKMDIRSDIYSLGCVMYECLNGSPPFSIGNLMETVYKHCYAFPHPIKVLSCEGRSLERYRAIVMKTLEKNPADRYQSMQALRMDLELLIAADEKDWKENALATKAPAKGVARAVRTATPKKQIFVALACLAFLFALCLSYFVMFPKIENQSTYDARLLWALKDKKLGPTIPNFEGKRNAALAELSSVEKESGKASAKYDATLYNLCNLLILGADWSDAIAELKELSDRYDRAKGPIDYGDIHSALALCYFAKGYYETAEYECKSVINNMEKGGSKSVESEISAMNILGDIYTRRANDNAAKDVYLALYKVAAKSKLRWPPVFGFACARLADSYRRLGDLPKAQQYYKEALDWWQNYVGRRGTFLPRALYGYGLVLAQEQQFVQALQQQKDALPLAIASTGQNSPLVTAIKQQYNECLFHANPSQWLVSKLRP